MVKGSRTKWIKIEYIEGLKGLILASTIFLEKPLRKKLNKDDIRYGGYLISRLYDINDESWRFSDSEKRIIAEALDVIKNLRETIKDVLNGKVDVDKIREVICRADDISSKLSFLSLNVYYQLL